MSAQLESVRVPLSDPGLPAGLFHPAVAGWFAAAFGEPTEVQRRAWQATSRHRNALIAAPTGSGKTLAAFLSAINDLVVQGLGQGLADEVQVLYVSPLKALSNDIQKNLEEPLAGICKRLRDVGRVELPMIRSAVRTGDTSAQERLRMKRAPPHILVTTPESLFILLGSDSGRAMLRSTRSVIVDELHACAGVKRGAHLALSLERLDALCERAPLRIGLSATQKPIQTMAQLLVGFAEDGQPRPCEIIDSGHVRHRDLALELPRSALMPVLSGEVWAEIYDRIAALAAEHRTTLVFVNQRRQAERVARALAERLGEEQVTAHHGSLAKEHRLRAEQQLKAGRLKALVATASLELGIDIGDVDLVCQIGSPRSINAFLQRVGRSGHAVRATPKGRLFPQSLDDLVECTALLDSVAHGELDRLSVCAAPLDVLAQQLVGELACREWTVDALHQRLRQALPYRDLALERFEQVLRMLADGYSTRRGRRGALIHFDVVNRRLRGRRGARLVAVSNAGTIPDAFDYEVVIATDGTRVGTLNEDFAFESLAGDIVQLGNTSWRILKVETSRVLVEDARGQPPNMPFWLGEAPGRTEELSAAVSRLRAQAQALLQDDAAGAQACAAWLRCERGLSAPAAQQLAAYLHSARRALGVLPTRECIVFERFFDEVGDTHLVIHAPLGSRINRAWGLALRKRFCRQFNFELQASALDDSLVLSLGPTHSFALADVRHFLHSATAREVLVQALLQAPMFNTRWRWAASIALAVPRMRNGRRLPPQFQRADAEDLLAHAFPDALACQDNLPGERALPQHPLVEQTVDDCLHEVMDAEGFLALLRRIEAGQVEILCRDLTAPSPLSASILNARPYAFLDDGAAEERRTRAVRTLDAGQMAEARDLGRLDLRANQRVREELWPDPTNADELHDSLVVAGFLTQAELASLAPPDWGAQLLQERRVARLVQAGCETLWTAAERLHELQAVLPAAVVEGQAPRLAQVPEYELALRELLRSRLELHGPIRAEDLGAPLGAAQDPSMAVSVQAALLALESQGGVMRGNFSGSGAEEWCERRRLARIHRYSRERRHAQVEPVPPAAFMRFLFDWQGLGGAESREGPAALEAVLTQLEGFPVAAAAWESEVLAARMPLYDPAWLDALCGAGRFVWRRPVPEVPLQRKAAPVRSTPILLLPRAHAAHWYAPPEANASLSGVAVGVYDSLGTHGASFFADLVADTGLLRSQVEAALAELVAQGLVSCDGFAGLRALIAPADLRARRLRRGGVMAAFQTLESAGRWSRAEPRRGQEPIEPDVTVEHVARVLLRRYGVVFRKLLEREPRLPPWRELLYALRRLEAREEIRGGRFVSAFSGEQFALPEAAGALPRYREAGSPQWVVVAACDPLNLSGLIVPGERLPAVPGNRLLFRDGEWVGTRCGKQIRFAIAADPSIERAWQQRLLGRRLGGVAIPA